MNKTLQDITGQKFGRLQVIERVENDRHGNTRFLCECDCGNELTALSGNIRAGKTQSCGCLNQENKIKPSGVSNANRVWRQYQNNAKTRSISFSLSKQEFMNLSQQRCFYCGILPATVQNDVKSNGPFVYNGIDRLDNKLGYIIDNVISCCNCCNIMKQSMQPEEFIIHIEQILNYQNR